MLDQTVRTQSWLAELAAIVADIEANGVPTPQPIKRRRRKPKPFWEE